MNLFFGILWLLGAVGTFGYGLYTGTTPLTIRGLNVSAGWLFLLLAAWNLVRWYAARAGKAEREALRIVQEARQRQARPQERPAEYHPEFDFTNKPPPPGDAPTAGG